MGIDTHSLNLLRYATAKYGPLGHAITLGRLNVLLGPRAATKWAGASGGAYAEEMLMNKFGAISVDSIDNSDYEGATIVADMNRPLPTALADQYDAVLDFGCTEHIFDVAQSMRNITTLCKPSGTILHAVPANGFCGHGFYQFSPELFFSLYTDRNGYTDTEVYLAELVDTRHWYRVSPPRDGRRINVRSTGEMYVMVITRRIADVPQNIQQSDYTFNWNNAGATPAIPHRPGRLAGVTELLSRHTFSAKLVHSIDSKIASNGIKTLRHHPALTRKPIRPLW